MSKIITVNDINSTKFYQLPKAFFHNPLYTEMKNESKIAYSILRDLLELSIKNNWINEKNEVYVKLSREKLMKYLNIKGKQKITKIMKELKDKELTVEKRIGLNKCNEIYVCIPEELNKIYSDEELLKIEDKSKEPVENTQVFENRISESSEIEPPKVLKSNVQTFENQTHTKTNITKTNITNTKNNNNRETEEQKTNVVVSTVKNIFAEDITDLEAKKIYLVAKGNIDLIKEKYLLALNTSNIKNLVGWIINAIKENYKEPIKKEKVDNFNNYTQRDYDFDDLEKKLLGW